LIRKREGNEAYESDEDKNPYASSVSTQSKVLFLLLIFFLGRRTGRRTIRRVDRRPCHSAAAAASGG
jgi:hypothetical protein